MAAVDTQLPAKQHGYNHPRVPSDLPILDCDIDDSLLQDSYTSTSSGILLPNAVYGVLNEVASSLWPDVDTDDDLVVDCLQGAMTNKVSLGSLTKVSMKTNYDLQRIGKIFRAGLALRRFVGTNASKKF